MKKNSVKNKNVLSALTIGISAMMFLQTPVSAFAAENGELGEDPGAAGGEPDVTVDTAQEAEPYVEVCSDAQYEAQEALDACTGAGIQVEATEEAPEAGSAGIEAAEAADIILNGDEDKNIPAIGSEATYEGAAEAIEALENAANAVITDDYVAPQAAAGEQATEGEQQAAGEQATEGEQAAEGGQAAEGEQAAEGGQVAEGEQAAEGGQAAEGEQAAEGGQVAEGEQSQEAAGPENPSAVTSLEEAAKDVAGAMIDLGEAEEANKLADAADKDAVEAVSKAADALEGDYGLLETAVVIETIVSDANDKVDELIQAIENAGSPEEVNKTKGELDEYISTKTEDLGGQIELYTRISENYASALSDLADAQERLKNAENTFDTELGEAADKTREAQADVAAAKQKVDNLADAMQAVQDALPDAGNAGADGLEATRGNDWQNLFGGNYLDSRNVMKQVLVDYYLSEVMGYNLLIDDEHEVTMDTKQDRNQYEKNYTWVEFSYIDDEGNEQRTTKYFNWDNIAKTDVDHQNQDKRQIPEAATAIVIYEKSEDEVKPKTTESIAKELLAAHENDELYSRNGTFIDNDANRSRCKQQGMYRLYQYTDDNGERQYITQFELYGGTPNLIDPSLANKNKVYNDQGDLTAVFTQHQNEDGSVDYENPSTQKKFKNLTLVTDEMLAVTQNKNGLYRDANCLILGDNETIKNVLTGQGGYSFVKENVVDRYGISEDVVNRLIEDNAKLNNFIDTNTTSYVTAVKAQYAAYAEQVNEAEIAVNNAVDQVNDLADAIDAVKDKTVRKSKTMPATQALGITDIATYLGIQDAVTPERAEKLNSLTVIGLISELNKLKQEADGKVEDAKLAYADVQTKFNGTAQIVSDVIEALNKGSGDEGSGVVAGDNVVEPAGDNVVEPAGDNVVEPAGGNTVNPAGDNVVEPAGDNVVEPAGDNVVEPAGDNVVEPAGGNTVNPAGGNTVNPAGDNVVEPAGDNIVEPTATNIADLITGGGNGSDGNVGGGSSLIDQITESNVVAPAGGTVLDGIASLISGEEAPAAQVQPTSPIAQIQQAAPAAEVQAAAPTATIADEAVATSATPEAPAAAIAAAQANETAIAAADMAGTTVTSVDGDSGAFVDAEAPAAVFAAALVDEGAQAEDVAVAATEYEAQTDAPAAQADGEVTQDAALQGGAAQGANVVTADIPDGDVAMAEDPGTSQTSAALTGQSVNTVNIEEDTEQVKVDIAEGDIALASTFDDVTETQKPNWLWLLLIAALGAKGKQMYDEHMKKKEEENLETDK